MVSEKEQQITETLLMEEEIVFHLMAKTVSGA